MIFECVNKTKNRNEKWICEITHFKNYGSHYEIVIKGRSRIHVLFGKTNLGGFVCMPDFKVGCHIIDLKNQSFNTEKLIGVLGKTDAVTVATALKVLAVKINY